MFEIGQTQIAALEAQREQSFRKSVAKSLQARWIGNADLMAPASLDAAVASAIARGKSYGLRQKFSLAMFIELMFLVGRDFDLYPPVHHLLTAGVFGLHGSGNADADERFAHMLETISSKHWENARRRCAPIAGLNTRRVLRAQP